MCALCKMNSAPCIFNPYRKLKHISRLAVARRLRGLVNAQWQIVYVRIKQYTTG